VHTLVYYAFDVLHFNGRDLIKTPLDERRALLTTVVKGIQWSTDLTTLTPAQREWYWNGATTAGPSSSSYAKGDAVPEDCNRGRAPAHTR
jgi:hypothetical protein